ncbi:MAG: hypothetical protein ABJO48_04040 [Nonlabens ulvanivorans]|uniref:hypothetical protein n=2 Tax=Nonlabens ulvanivorans TaxID=906888 RepID=UPI0032990632
MRYFIFFILIGINVQAQRYNSPKTYLEFVDKNHEQVIEQTWNYMYRYSQEPNLQKRNGQRKVLENVLKRAIRNIEKERPFDTDLQQAAVKYLNGNLAIVKEDYVQLLKLDSSKEPLVDKSTIFRKIRNAMYQLRKDYDRAVVNYGLRHNLIISENDNELAQKMAATIKIYDYYNEMNMLVLQIKNAEAYLWQDISQLTPQQFNNRLIELKNTIEVNNNKAIELSESIDIASLQSVYNDFTKLYSHTFFEKTSPITVYLTAAANNDRTDILQKTDAFNQSKTWFNINRKKAYTIWSYGMSQYLKILLSELE